MPQSLFSGGALNCHEHHFQHAQEADNCFNFGQPKDILEFLKTETQHTCNSESNTQRDAVEEMGGNHSGSLDAAAPPDNAALCVENDNLMIRTRVIVESGSHDCGNHLTSTPLIVKSSALAELQSNPDKESAARLLNLSLESDHVDKPSALPRQSLHTLMTKKAVLLQHTVASRAGKSPTSRGPMPTCRILHP